MTTSVVFSNLSSPHRPARIPSNTTNNHVADYPSILYHPRGYRRRRSTILDIYNDAILTSTAIWIEETLDLEDRRA